MKYVKLNNLFDFLPKSKIKAGDGLRKGRYPFYSSSENQSKYLDEYLYEPGCLVFGTGGKASVHFTISYFSTSTDCITIKPKSNVNIDAGYVYQYFKGNMHVLESGFKGAGLKHISKVYLSDIQIPHPEKIDDQIRIATLLSKVENLIFRRREQLKQLDELLKSIFLEMFGDPVRNEKGWEMKRMDEISDSRLGKMRDKKFITGNHLRKYIGNSNVQWFRFKLDDLEEMDFDERERALFGLKNGDLLICEGGDIGRCAIWRNNLTECYFQKAIHRVRLYQSQAIPEYVQYVMMFFSLYNGFKNVTCKSTIAHLTGEKLKETLIPVPPLELQNRFAAIVTKVESAKDHYIKSLNNLEFLYNAVSQKAFKGELDLSLVPLVKEE